MKSKKPLVSIILGTLIGASSGLFIKSISFSSLAFSGFRMGVPFLILLPMMIKKGLVLGPRVCRKKLWFGSLFNAVRMLLYILAYKLTSMANGVVLLYLWPLFALLLEAAFRKKKLKLKEIGLLFLALLGVICLNLEKGFSLSPNDLMGSICMIASAFIFSASALIFKDALVDHSEVEVLYFQNALGAVVFLPFMLAELPVTAAAETGVAAIYGLLVGIVAFGCMFYAMKRMPMFQYGALTYLEVIFGVFLGMLFLQEGFSLFKGLGILMVLSASILSRFAGDSAGPAEDNADSDQAQCVAMVSPESKG